MNRVATKPVISVCIPAYNRSNVLSDLLDSIVTQQFSGYEILICEDMSPERKVIGEIVRGYMRRYPSLIRYIENENNLGYDGNIRHLIDMARGEYCFFMGNDDIMCQNALECVASAVKRYPDVGVVLRSYAAFDGEPENVVQKFQYFPDERFFPAGAATIATVYRRSVVIPGLVLHRKSAQRFASNRFDGTLLYQLYLVANILVEKNAVFLPDILALYRNGGVPDFGNAEAEQGCFVPNEQTPESSVHFVKGLLSIAAFVEKEREVSIYQSILHDVGNYSLPILDVQRERPLPVFIRYAYELSRLGLWRSPMFYVYFLLLLVLGKQNVWLLVRCIKKMVGYTPSIGSFFKGSCR